MALLEATFSEFHDVNVLLVISGSSFVHDLPLWASLEYQPLNAWTFRLILINLNFA